MIKTASLVKIYVFKQRRLLLISAFTYPKFKDSFKINYIIF